MLRDPREQPPRSLLRSRAARRWACARASPVRPAPVGQAVPHELRVAATAARRAQARARAPHRRRSTPRCWLPSARSCLRAPRFRVSQKLAGCRWPCAACRAGVQGSLICRSRQSLERFPQYRNEARTTSQPLYSMPVRHSHVTQNISATVRPRPIERARATSAALIGVAHTRRNTHSVRHKPAPQRATRAPQDFRAHRCIPSEIPCVDPPGAVDVRACRLRVDDRWLRRPRAPAVSGPCLA